MTKFVPLTFLCMLMICTILSAQSPAGSYLISAGIGILPTYTGKTTETTFSPICFQVGYRVSNVFSLNAFAGYTEASSTPRFISDGIESYVTNKTTILGLRGQLHKSITKKVEIYGGAFLGRAFFNTHEKDVNTGEEVIRLENEPTPYDPNAPKGQFMYSGFIGGKYWFSKIIGIYSEIGYGVSFINSGFSVNF